VFEEFVAVAEEDEQPLQLEHSITHALVVTKSHEGYLLLFNAWRQHWEVAGGIKEDDEIYTQYPFLGSRRIAAVNFL
jgi:8-oxo-dGTP diphosphatase